MYDIILFDLDGTLTDSGQGIVNSVAYALKKMGIEEPERRKLFRFVGPPLIPMFQKTYGMTEEEARQGLVYYREYFQDKGIFENQVYPGIKTLLGRLKEAGKTLMVATSKPEVYANRIMEHFHLAEYFACVAGASMDETRVSKADVIEYGLETLGVSDRSRLVMVGDREHDVLGARKAGMASIGVLYGYGDRQELESAGATHIAGTVEDIYEIVCGSR